jgi:hypothetical protein
MNIDRKKFNLVVLIDLKKAFDTSSNYIEEVRALWNKRTSSNLAQILSYEPKSEMPDKKLLFIRTID